MRITGLLLLLFLGIFIQGIAQQQIYMLRNYETKKDKQNDLVFLHYPYLTPTLNLTHFQANFPDSRKASSSILRISPPDISDLEDVVVAVAYLEKDPRRPGALIIFLIGNYYSPNPVYFFDHNLDRDFTNDGDPFVFPEGVEYYEIVFSNPQKDLEPYKVRILNPANQLELDDRRFAKKEKKKNAEITSDNWYRNFSFQIGPTIGFGSINFTYQDPNTGYATRYRVPYNVKGLGLQLNYSLNRLRIGAQFQYENLFYWTSERRTQIGEPFWSCVGADCKWIDNIIEEHNQDLHPTGAIVYGMSVAYDFHLGKMMFFSPNISFNRFTFISELDGYNPYRYRDPEVIYKFERNLSTELGLDFSAGITPKSRIYIHLGGMIRDFRPEGYFNRPEVDNVTRNNRMLRAGFGYMTYF